jgi:ParB family chromosome partitioning protein
VLAREQEARGLVETATGRRVLLPVMLGQKHTATLVDLARAGGKDPARLVALASLGRIGGSDAESTLTAIFRDQAEDAGTRAAAFRALRRLQRRAASVTRFGQSDQA